MLVRRRIVIFALVGLAATGDRAAADALVVTRAMEATTIAEIFIDEDSIRLEIEIGLPDLEAFRNVLPDEIDERLSEDPRPIAERVQRFMREDFVIRADGGGPLVGEIGQVIGRRRVKRDEITGESLAAADDEGEPVIFVELNYPLVNRPSSLSFKPPKGGDGDFVSANIGFVVYHRGLPANDFRYLGQTETLDLDWEDPWYSRFRNRNLRRRYDAPLAAFLYVDHFEVRKEIIVRPKDLQSFIDLGLEDEKIIRAQDQAALKERVAEFLLPRNPVRIDGRAVEPILDRIHFVRRKLRRTGVIDPPQDLSVISATLGVIFVYPVTGLPQEVTMEWEMFNDRVQWVPTVATDEAGGLPYRVSADDPVLRWQNFLKNPSSAALVELAPPPAPSRLPVPVLSALCVLLATAAFVRFHRSAAPRPRFLGAAAAVLLVGAALLWPFVRFAVVNPIGGPAAVSNADAGTIVSGLLRNVYRAFDYRDESVIYDTLQRSAAGDLLTQIYLETQRALELQNQGGARAKVKEVQIIDSTTSNIPGEVGFISPCTWNVTGSVGHWGHIHQRRNQYEAILTVKPVDGVWKITDLELLGEERL